MRNASIILVNNLVTFASEIGGIRYLVNKTPPMLNISTLGKLIYDT